MNSQVSSIAFRKRNKKMDWKKIEEANLDEIESGLNLENLQKNLSNITFCNIQAEMADSKPKNFLKAFIIAQYIIEYLMYCQEQSEKKIVQLNQETESQKRVKNALKADFLNYKINLLQTILSMAKMLADKETQMQNQKINKRQDPESFIFKELHADVTSLTQLNSTLLQTIEVLIKEINMLAQLMTRQRSGWEKEPDKQIDNDSSDNDSNTFTVKNIVANTENIFEEVSSTTTEAPNGDETIVETSSKWDENEFSLKDIIAKATEASFHFSQFGINFDGDAIENGSKDSTDVEIPTKLENDLDGSRDSEKLEEDEESKKTSLKEVSGKDLPEVLDSDRSDSSGSFLELAQNEDFSDSSLKSPDFVPDKKFGIEKRSDSNLGETSNEYEIPRSRLLSESVIHRE